MFMFGQFGRAILILSTIVAVSFVMKGDEQWMESYHPNGQVYIRARIVNNEVIESMAFAENGVMVDRTYFDFGNRLHVISNDAVTGQLITHRISE
jgi:hypothetical protein